MRQMSRLLRNLRQKIMDSVRYNAHQGDKFTMKLFFALTCAFLCVCFCLPIAAFAETSTEWVRVTDDEVRLYANCENSKAIFLLQKSYYLHVLNEENGMYLVSVMQNEKDFPQICGYVWKAEVEKCDEEPLPPYYPTEKVTVNADSAQLRLSPVPSAEIVLTVTNTQTVSFYGEISSYNQKWYYVYYGGKFGYVLANNVTKPVIALHPTPLATEPVVAPPQIDDETETTENNGGVTEILLILFVIVLAVGICLALFLPGNVKKREIFDKDI